MYSDGKSEKKIVGRFAVAYRLGNSHAIDQKNLADVSRRMMN
jgi:hypothetical protein